METSADPGTALEIQADRTAACKRRVLVVDDNQDIAESSAWLLRLQGHEVQTALDGRGAIELALSFRPDAALLDVGLPDINGYELARRLRAEFGSDVVLIIVTAYTRDFGRQQSDVAAYDHFFLKPLDFSVIAALLA
jgi:DNA-binding response OmpR family regulator